MFKALGFSCSQILQNYMVLQSFDLSVPDECYFRTLSCYLNSIHVSTFFLGFLCVFLSCFMLVFIILKCKVKCSLFCIVVLQLTLMHSHLAWHHTFKCSNCFYLYLHVNYALYPTFSMYAPYLILFLCIMINSLICIQDEYIYPFDSLLWLYFVSMRTILLQ
jgi:hypothetical protein